MKPVLKDGKLSVDLAIREQEILGKAREIGVLLDSMHQPSGAALVAAVDAVLRNGSAASDE